MPVAKVVPPYPFKCEKCGHEVNLSSQENNPTVPKTRDSIHCPECWRTFLRQNIGTLKPMAAPKE